MLVLQVSFVPAVFASPLVLQVKKPVAVFVSIPPAAAPTAGLVGQSVQEDRSVLPANVSVPLAHVSVAVFVSML
jgi:hypothetical protein